MRRDADGSLKTDWQSCSDKSGDGVHPKQPIGRWWISRCPLWSGEDLTTKQAAFMLHAFARHRLYCLLSLLVFQNVCVAAWTTVSRYQAILIEAYRFLYNVGTRQKPKIDKLICVFLLLTVATSFPPTCHTLKVCPPASDG